jgi:hypothetical protein
MELTNKQLAQALRKQLKAKGASVSNVEEYMSGDCWFRTHGERTLTG